eukprot:4592764-Pyramimonas_sp.AAC.1
MPTDHPFGTQRCTVRYVCIFVSISSVAVPQLEPTLSQLEPGNLVELVSCTAIVGTHEESFWSEKRKT